MKRIAALFAALACASVVAVLPAAAADGPIKTYSQDVTIGFFRGQVVSYLDLGPVRLARGNKVEPIWAFTNGDEGQRNVIDTVPGMRDYTPLWAVRMVTWRSGKSPRVLRSAAAIRAAQRSGDVTIANASVVVNCPVL
jgi:hypothetical protein